MNLEKNDKWPKMMIVGSVLACSAGTVIMPFTADVVATFGYLTAADDSYSYNYLSYLIFMIILNIGIAALYFLFCRFIMKPDMSRLSGNIEIGKIEPFTKQQKIAAVALAALVFFTILPSCLPNGSLKNYLNTLGTTATVLLITGIVTFFRDKEGKSYFSFQELGKNGVFWGMLLMVGTAVTIGTALATGEKGGVDVFGVPWKYIEVAGGSMVELGVPLLKDCRQWKKVIRFPDISQWDWEGCAKENEKYLDTDRVVCMWKPVLYSMLYAG